MNGALVPCEECIFIIPKHKSGRNLFVEMAA
jgi:hypothetical protein